MSTMDTSQLVVPETVAVAARDPVRASRFLHWTVWLAAIGVLAAAVILEVSDETTVTVPVLNYTLPELCYWRTMFGMDCPGCGLTRCFISAAHGDVAAAWHYNPMGLLLFAAVVVQIPFRPWQLWRLATRRGELRTLELPYVMLGLSVLLIVQWFWRLLA
jgi:hypothetical protein